MRLTLFIFAGLLAILTRTPAVASNEGWVAARIESAMADYESGDYHAARRGFLRAADHGSAIAETMLGSIYSGGLGVPIDHAVAAAYYYRAAERGYGPAQLALSDMYASGVGVKVSARRAYFWATLALNADIAEVVSKAEIRRTALALRLAPGDSEKLQREAAKWRPRARRFR